MERKKRILKYAAASAIIAGVFLLIPLTAMQFTREVNWSLFDFFAAGLMIFVTVFSYKLISALYPNFRYRFAVAIAVITALFILWANLAVGIVGSENNSFNYTYIFLLLAGFISSLVVRFKPAGMAYTLYSASAAMIIITTVVIAISMRQTEVANELPQLIVFHLLIATMFSVSGFLFNSSKKMLTTS